MTNEKIWRLLPPSPNASRLTAEAGVSPLKAQLLLNRGITDSVSVQAFLSPRLSDLMDPMRLKDMDRAIDLIIRAMKEGERIAVFGDYDADGLTATALMLNLFSELGVRVSSYIPNRLEEGYSLNCAAVKTLADRGVRLIITVDCGISNNREIRMAKELGMEVVVTDHHQVPEDFDPLCPVINPNRSDSLFPFRDLAGVGVAFFLAVGLRSVLRDAKWFRDIPEPDLKAYLDLVALGTVADMVPLKGQNRILVTSGIETMKNSRWPGINALKDASGMSSREISAYDLAYKLAPRLNAPGRLGDPAIGLTALTTDQGPIAAQAARELNGLNSRRQEIEGDIIEEIEESLIPGYGIENRKTIVLARDGWHEGVLGIVASRLLDRYRRPALVLSIRDNVAKGSGRSIDGFNLHRAMTKLAGLFEKFGGHYHAAGCTLKASDVKALAEGLEEIAQRELREEDLIPSIEVDSEIGFQELTMETVSQILSLAPFGAGNPEPLFHAGDLNVLISRVVGERHLKLTVRQGEKVMEAIGFGLGDRRPREGDTINMIFTPEIDLWNGYKKIQLRINDLELKGEKSRLLRPGG